MRVQNVGQKLSIVLFVSLIPNENVKNVWESLFIEKECRGVTFLLGLIKHS